MALKLITPPQTTPVTLDQVKKHLRVDWSDDDDFLQDIVMPAAVGHVDGKTGWLQRALIDQTWELVLDRFPWREIKIPLPPLIQIESIKYHDAAGDEQTLVEDDDYTVDADSQPGWVVPVGSWPVTFSGINAVRIRYRAGYVDNTNSPAVANVPAPIKAGILLYAGTLYENRETIVIGQTAVALPWAAEELLRPYRIF